MIGEEGRELKCANRASLLPTFPSALVLQLMEGLQMSCGCRTAKADAAAANSVALRGVGATLPHSLMPCLEFC